MKGMDITEVSMLHHKLTDKLWGGGGGHSYVVCMFVCVNESESKSDREKEIEKKHGGNHLTYTCRGIAGDVRLGSKLANPCLSFNRFKKHSKSIIIRLIQLELSQELC